MKSCADSYKQLLEKYKELQRDYIALKMQNDHTLLQKRLNQQREILKKQRRDKKFYILELQNRETEWNMPFMPFNVALFNPLTKKTELPKAHTRYAISSAKIFTY